jgi:hypothetical protein
MVFRDFSLDPQGFLTHRKNDSQKKFAKRVRPNLFVGCSSAASPEILSGAPDIVASGRSAITQ